MNDPRHIVISVGPCVGKTTMMMHSLAASMNAGLVILPPHFKPPATSIEELERRFICDETAAAEIDTFMPKKSPRQRANSNAPFYRSLPKYQKRRRP